MTPGLMTRGRVAAAPPASRAGGRRDFRRLPSVVPSRVVLIGGAAALLALLCALFADVPVAHRMAGLSPDLRGLASMVSALGDSGYMLVSSGLLALAVVVVRRRGGPLAANRPVALLGERAAFVFATVAVSGLLAQLVKHVVGRARPKLVDTLGPFHFDLFSIKASLASFPSGHTASAFGLALALGMMERRLAAPLLLAAAAVGAARVGLGAHFPSDVVAGACLGSLTTLALAASFARRAIAFAERDDRLVLKGDGSVWPGLVALARRGTGRA